MPDPPIPDRIWRRLLDFLAAGKTGHVMLYISNGKVVDSEFKDRVRAAPVVDSRQNRGD
jgi:hypothetical protein